MQTYIHTVPKQCLHSWATPTWPTHKCVCLMMELVVMSKGMVMKEMMRMSVLVMLFKILVKDEYGGLDEGCST